MVSDPGFRRMVFVSVAAQWVIRLHFQESLVLVAGRSAQCSLPTSLRVMDCGVRASVSSRFPRSALFGQRPFLPKPTNRSWFLSQNCGMVKHVFCSCRQSWRHNQSFRVHRSWNCKRESISWSRSEVCCRQIFRRRRCQVCMTDGIPPIPQETPPMPEDQQDLEGWFYRELRNALGCHGGQSSGVQRSARMAAFAERPGKIFSDVRLGRSSGRQEKVHRGNTDGWESSVRNSRCCLRGVRLGEASHPGPPGRRSRNSAEELLDNLERELDFESDDEPLVRPTIGRNVVPRISTGEPVLGPTSFGQAWFWPGFVWPKLVLVEVGLSKVGLANVGHTRGCSSSVSTTLRSVERGWRNLG